MTWHVNNSMSWHVLNTSIYFRHSWGKKSFCLGILFLFSGLLAWRYDDDDGDSNMGLNDGAPVEDAMGKKRRLQNELTHALGVLGVKHSTFHSMLKRGEHPQVRKMLKEHLKGWRTFWRSYFQCQESDRLFV